jgi:hypothetical protein
MNLFKIQSSMAMVGVAMFMWAQQSTAQTIFTIATEYPGTAMPTCLRSPLQTHFLASPLCHSSQPRLMKQER